MSKGTLYIISAPSGAGKTSLLKALMAHVETDHGNSIVVCVSHTTRAMREGEVDGVDYHFVEHDVFEKMVEKDAFLEHAHVFDHHYGTSAQHVQQQLMQGYDVILEIDWQGARQVRGQFKDALSVFILPPSAQALAERLQNRGQDDKSIIDRRMKDALKEMSHYNEFDYIVVNDDFDVAQQELSSIFKVNRLRQAQQAHALGNLLTELLK